MVRRIVMVLLLWPTVAAVSSGQTGNGNASSTNFRIELPVSGVEIADWVISQYYDHDPSDAVRDYLGGTKIRADGHDGIDFAIPNFRWMDREQVFVLAVADGRVVDTRDGQYDRNLSCEGRSNFVKIEHSNGYLSKYYHLKNGSVGVSTGEEVVAGQELGVVGSSGCSTGPHLHFELVDDNGTSIDPFLQELWVDPPSYDVPFTVMDYVILDRRMESRDLRDPPPDNVTSISAGKGVIGVGMSLTGVEAGYRLRYVLSNGNVTIKHTGEFKAWRNKRSRGRNFSVAKTSGIWRIEVYLNRAEEPAFRHEVRVNR